MGEEEALRAAIDLLHMPSRVRMLRAEPLPHGVALLLRIAAEDAGAVSEAAQLADRSPSVVREAAAFYIEQILLSPEADSYRVLGATPQGGSGELRANMALLMKWLHPDSDRHAQQSVFVNRVTKAWDDLKTAERRAAYDQGRRAAEARRASRRQGRRARGGSGLPGARHIPVVAHRQGLLRRMLAFLLGGPRR
jgi:hypothetical protein